LNQQRAMRLCLLALVALAACRPPGYGKDDKPDAAQEQPDGGGSAGDAALDTPLAATCDHAFRLDGYGTASSVWLSGSFVTWATTPGAGAVAFTLGVDGAWTGSYPFEAGTHQYKFIVDGSNWILDPTNQNTADDGMGNTNSVYTCVP
jgi:hypothetical protein